MKEIVKRRSKTISATNCAEFDKRYNSTSDELAQYDPEVETFNMDGTMYARFTYEERTSKAETIAEDFMQHNVGCTCSDCPYLKIGTDARRRWFPCEYSECGETRIDSPACDEFYRQAVKRMREEANR